jgi:limonene-1,2-epoxide hydrolase
MNNQPGLPINRRELFAASAFGAALLRFGVLDDRAAIAAVLARFRRAYERVDPVAAEAVLAPDLVFSDPTFGLKANGIAELRPIIGHAGNDFSAITLKIEHELISPPWAVVRQEQILVLKNPAGRRVSVRGISMFRIAGDRIAEWHDYYDRAGFERQMAEIKATPLKQ